MFNNPYRTTLWGAVQPQGSATGLQPAPPIGHSQIDRDDDTVPENQFKPRALVVDDSTDIAFMMVMIFVIYF